MVRRTRDIQKKIWLTPQEERTIAKKMEMIGTENFGAYARKMLIDGYIIVVDYTEQKKLAAEINKIGVNINTVCRRINSTGRFYQDDIDELKEKMDAVWQLLSSFCQGCAAVSSDLFDSCESLLFSVKKRRKHRCTRGTNEIK